MQRDILNTSCTSKAPDPVVQLWLLRILVRMESTRNWMNNPDWDEEEAVSALGLKESELKIKGPALRRLLMGKLEHAERVLVRWRRKGVLQDNIAMLARLVNFSEVDRKILEFAICLHHNQVLSDATDKFGSFNRDKVHRLLACALDLSIYEVRKALSNKGQLARTGLVKLDDFGRSMRDRLELINSEFHELMSSEPADPKLILRGLVNLAPEAQLALDDYPHLRSSLQLLIPYLKHSLEQRKDGVNILIYGPPGMGKTQLTRVLARHLDVELFEVASEDDDGDPASGSERLRAYQAAQSFFSEVNCMMVFDEIEDVMTESPFSPRRAPAQSSKAWMNRCLESNVAPTLWLANSIRSMDNAFIRRFDMVLELPVPPKAQRQRIIEQACGDLVSTSELSCLSDSDDLSPAVVARASKVVNAVSSAIAPGTQGSALLQLVNGTLQAQGHSPILRHDPNRLPEVYDPQFIHADTDLAALLPGLKQQRCARMCLYGPPGTGKTAYGRWLAEQLQMPLVVKRASDLMSKWVGETEKNIAAAFQEAQAEQALLMIDEVDSFLQDRRQAARGWEVTQVNEMLTQMESFAGIFIASTNLMDGLDQAALRRFDLKVKFGFLRPPQVWALFQRCCAQLQLPLGDEAGALSLQAGKLDKATPGDFATVMRQHRFKPFTSAQSLLQALLMECRLKAGNTGTSIGFI